VKFQQPASDASSFTFEPGDIAFDSCCADLLSKHILANTNDIRKVKDIASRMLERSLEHKVTIGIIGEAKSGKTSLIEALLGSSGSSGIKPEVPISKEKFRTRLRQARKDYAFPDKKNIKFAEIKVWLI